MPEPLDDTDAATRQGPGRVLITVYAIFALAATARSLEQIATKFHVAPLAFLLSAFAGIVYVVATISLIRGWRRVARITITTEAVGVVVIGAASLIFTSAFPKPTVWSGFGYGYAFVPLVLPFVGLWWLHKTEAVPAA